MTVLAVFGLTFALVLYASQQEGEIELGMARAAVEQERAKNRAMYDAMQQVQEIIDQISKDTDLVFGDDQSLSFGEDLVSFERNGLELLWREGGQDRLREFCQSLASALSRAEEAGLGNQGKKPFTLFVEGHTDSTGCSANPHCNWYFSMGRATSFVSWMEEGEHCPAAFRLDVRPVGYADTRPEAGGPATRRVTLRLVPDYEQLIATGLGGRTQTSENKTP